MVKYLKPLDFKKGVLSLARRKKFSGGKKKQGFRKKDNPGERLRKPLLNLGRLDYFKYDLNEIVEGSDMNEDLRPSFMASVTAKASQRSISDAKDYISELEGREELSEETAQRIKRLLDRYTKVR